MYSTLGTLGASDKRIKSNIIDIDDGYALETLRKLKPKRYNYIDTLKHDKEPVFGFIAQEVREVLPYATNLKEDYIPNIYEIANVHSNILTFEHFNTSNLENSSSIIRILNINGNYKDITLNNVIDDKSFSIVEDINKEVDSNSNIFVYGQYIKDFVLLKKMQYLL